MFEVAIIPDRHFVYAFHFENRGWGNMQSQNDSIHFISIVNINGWIARAWAKRSSLFYCVFLFRDTTSGAIGSHPHPVEVWHMFRVCGMARGELLS